MRPYSVYRECRGCLEALAILAIGCGLIGGLGWALSALLKAWLVTPDPDV